MDGSKRLTSLVASDAELAESSDDDGVSLEELSQSYQRVQVSQVNSLADNLDSRSLGSCGVPDASDAQVPFDPLEESQSDTEHCPLTPLSIVEAVLFLGRPDGGAITAAEIAALMRGVAEAEVDGHVAQLNSIYQETGRAHRIVAHGNGYRVQLADDLQFIRDRFYGRIRPVKLNQASIDCLALISYQPGITRETLEEQRGQPSGSVLSQLVRRQLIEIHREHDGKKLVGRYYPTERLLELAGIQSLDDLPQTEDL